jgi:tight adherence protein C
MGTQMILALMLAGGILLFFFGLAMRPSMNTAEMVQERLKTYGGEKPLTIEEMELQRPFTDRMIRPIIEKLGARLAKSTPEKTRIDLQNRLNLAGVRGMAPSDFTAIRYVCLVIGAAVGLLLGLLINSSTNNVFLFAGSPLLLGLAGLYGPNYWLKSKVDARRKEIQKGLPDAMDLLTIAVEAGLGFDAAMARVTEKFKNALSEEFAQVLQETRLGRPRLEALDDMGRRTGVEDLHNFVQAVIQSEQMGVGVAKILRLQSDEMRRKRRQRAQEKAAQASLKMMLPMVGCIFPTIWIVLIGPAILIVMKAQAGG